MHFDCILDEEKETKMISFVLRKVNSYKFNEIDPTIFIWQTRKEENKEKKKTTAPFFYVNNGLLDLNICGVLALASGTANE